MAPRRRALVALLLAATAALGGAASGSAGSSASAQSGADDPGLSRQWGLERIGAPAAWAAGYTGAGTTIAIVDSGVDPDHPDLRDKLGGTAALVDCVGHDDVPSGCIEGSGGDDAGHGTHVAGIAAASTGNGTGVAGVAPDARLLSVRALAQVCDTERRCEAQGSTRDVAEAIRWAADHGADVINLSLGSATQQLLGPAFGDALQHAWDAGAIPVLAAGNTPLPVGSLFGIRAVLVAGTTNTDGRASYSGALGSVDWAVSAPGGEADDAASCEAAVPNGVLSTWVTVSGGTSTPGYACVAGTSMAAPHVSGALAVLLGAGYDPGAAISRLIATADDLGPPGRDADFGSGRINLARALGVTATGGPGVTTGDPTTSTAPGELTEVPGDVQPTPALPFLTTTTVVAPTTTAQPLEPGVTTPPVVDDVAGSFPLDLTDDERRLPAGPLTVAVLAVLTSFGGHAWRYLATTSWARRTPDR